METIGTILDKQTGHTDSPTEKLYSTAEDPATAEGKAELGDAVGPEVVMEIKESIGDTPPPPTPATADTTPGFDTMGASLADETEQRLAARDQKMGAVQTPPSGELGPDHVPTEATVEARRETSGEPAPAEETTRQAEVLEFPWLVVPLQVVLLPLVVAYRTGRGLVHLGQKTARGLRQALTLAPRAQESH